MANRAGDYDYDRKGGGYASRRVPDPRIAAAVHAALGDARTVLNVGAGAGSYEPEDRYVLAVEPSPTMRAQRSARAVPAIRGVAQALPLDDGAVDASMSILSVHHWLEQAAGLAEMRRVTRGPVVLLTFDPDALHRLWLFDYGPELLALEKARFPTLSVLAGALGGAVDVVPVPIPLDCTDGFGEAFYGRPEAFLDSRVRAAQSAWGFLEKDVEARIVDHIARDLASGEWDRRLGALRTRPTFDGSVRIVVGRPARG